MIGSLSKKAVEFKRNISPVREIMQYADSQYIKKIGLKQEDIISFAGGWVNHNSPANLQDSYKEIIQDKNLFHKSGGYSPTLGMFECKEAITKYEEYLYGIKNLNPKQIAVGASSTQLTFDLLKVLLNPGDKILLLDPSYCNYPTQIFMSMDIEILRFPVLDVESWSYIADKKIKEFSEFILKNKPKVILLVSPDNPTSQVLSDKFVSSALEAAKEVGAFIVMDFAYKDILFQEKPKYFSWEPNDNFISIYSNSKWGRGLGRRLGWVQGPEFVIEAMESFLNSSILCPDTLHQMALIRYIENSIKDGSLKKYLKESSNKYEIAAKHTVDSIKKHIGLPYLNSQGGLYTCVNVNRDGASFVRDLLSKTGVLFVPGWGFGKTLSNGVRISYGPLVNNLERIDEGMEKVGEYLKNH